MKHLVTVIIVLVIVAGVGWAVYHSVTERETQIVLTGIVTTDDVIVSAQVQGRLSTLSVKQGDRVEPGQVLAKIEPEYWESDLAFYQHAQEQAGKGVTEAEANLRLQELQVVSQVDQAQASLASAKAQVAQGQADLSNAKTNLDLETQIYNSHAETRQAFDQAQANFDSQKARVDSLLKLVTAGEAAVALAQANREQVAARRAGLEASQSQLAAAQSQTDKAKVQLSYTQVCAPIAGIVDTRVALQGEVVNPAQAIVTLINPRDLWVRADVEETYINRVHLGDKMTVRLPWGEEREGVVFFRGIDADYATQRDVSRTKRDIKTFEVRLRCDNSHEDLAVGMTAYVTLPLEK